MNDSLFIFTIAPVQSFIAQARKTQDLSGGSRLLSDLIGEVVNKIEKAKGTILFPKRNNASSNPNRLIARIPKEHDGIGRDIEDFVRGKLSTCFEEALRNESLSLPQDVRKKCYQQISNFLQTFWAVLPISSDINQESYQKTEEVINAVKNTRIFKQQENEQGEKCNVCGERDFIFYADKPVRGNRHNKTTLKVNNNKNVTENEGLCAICFTKRFYDKIKFPSTTDIALAHTLAQLRKKPESESCLNNFGKIFGNDFDEQLYYAENLTEKYFKKYGLTDYISNSKLSEIRTAQKKIEDSAKDEGLTLNKYYALIMLDADDLGKWLSGKFIKTDELPEKLSEQFGKFAKDINSNVFNDKASGELVYAGGDDALAFININHFFEVIKKIRNCFPSQIEGIEISRKLTFSAGVVIAHYKTPLSEVLKWVRIMQNEAKAVEDKDAFGLALMTHSGNMLKLVGKWEHFNLLKTLVGFRENFSYKFAFSFKTEMLPVFERNEWNYDGLDYVYDIVFTEMKRLLLRAKKESIVKDKAVEMINGQEPAFKDFMAFNIKEIYRQYQFDIHNYCALMEIARFLASEIGERIKVNDSQT